MIEEEEEEQEEGEEEEEEEHINIEEENNTTINTNINRKKSKSRRRYVHFGKDVIDPEKEALRIKKLIYKVKVGTRIISFVAILALTQEIINRTLFNGKNEHLYNGLITCFVIGMFTFFYLLHRNLSIAVACKLLHEPNVLFIILLGIFNVIVEIVKPFDHMSVFLACTYLFNGIFFILFDAMERKNRGMIIVVGIVFALITVYNMYSVTFTHIDNNTILFQYGSSYRFYKRPIKRSLYFQILTFSIKALYSMISDTKMKRLMFITSNIYREDVASVATKKNSINNDDNSLKFMISLDLQNINKENEGSRRSRLSQLVQMERYRKGEVFFSFFCVILFMFYAIYNSNVHGLWVVIGVYISSIMMLFSFLFGIAYNNIDWNIGKNILLKEVNVIAIVFVSIILLLIDITHPGSPMSIPLSIMYVLCTWIFLCFDCLKYKDRKFTLFIGSLYLFVSLYEIIDYTILESGRDVIVLEYMYGLKLYKRSISRSIFFQLLALSSKAIYVLIKDKKGELLLYATGNVYRISGETSLNIHKAKVSYLKSRQVERLKNAQTSMVMEDMRRGESLKN